MGVGSPSSDWRASAAGGGRTKVLASRLTFAAGFETIFGMDTNAIAKTSDITIRVSLNEERVPVRIEWSASDMHEAGRLDECKAMAIALFDKEHRDTLRIDLWTEEMQVLEMDRFVYQILRSLSQTYLRATQNKEMAEEMAKFAHYFGEKTEIVPKEG
jgi:gliding motility-associated protein GldC